MNKRASRLYGKNTSALKQESRGKAEGRCRGPFTSHLSYLFSSSAAITFPAGGIDAQVSASGMCRSVGVPPRSARLARTWLVFPLQRLRQCRVPPFADRSECLTLLLFLLGQCAAGSLRMWSPPVTCKLSRSGLHYFGNPVFFLGDKYEQRRREIQKNNVCTQDEGFIIFF